MTRFLSARSMLVGAGLFSILMFAGTAHAGPIINVAGSTLGCFGTGCSIFTSPATSDPAYGLTFTGTSFTATTDGSGSASNIDLGSLARGNTDITSSMPALEFTLEVTFTVPTGINGGDDTFTATIKGKNSGGGGPAPIDFDNTWQVFTYSNASGSGSFEFSVGDLDVNKNSSTTILGAIRNASFTPTETVPTPVPEPATLTLLASGAAALAVRRHRRSIR